MVTLMLLPLFFGFYLNYASSKRMKVQSYLGFETWTQKNRGLSKIIGISLLCTSLVLNGINYGLGAGSFTFLVALMTMGSLIVLLSPLKLLNLKVLASAFVLGLLAEFFIL